MLTNSLTLAANKKVNFMAKKKKDKQLDESVAEEDTQKEEEKVIETPPVKKSSGQFLATEWAKQDPDKPDPHLFVWWDKEGAISKDAYEEVKAKVFKKK